MLSIPTRNKACPKARIRIHGVLQKVSHIHEITIYVSLCCLVYLNHLELQGYSLHARFKPLLEWTLAWRGTTRERRGIASLILLHINSECSPWQYILHTPICCCIKWRPDSSTLRNVGI